MPLLRLNSSLESHVSQSSIRRNAVSTHKNSYILLSCCKAFESSLDLDLPALKVSGVWHEKNKYTSYLPCRNIVFQLRIERECTVQCEGAKSKT